MFDIAGSGQDFAHEAIIRLVAGEALANPFMKGVGPMLVSWFHSFVAQQGGPFVGKIIRVITTGQKSFNPVGAFG